MLLTIIIGVYGYFELLKLVTNGGARVSSHSITSKVPSDEAFDHDKRGNGLEFAFGISAFDND